MALSSEEGSAIVSLNNMLLLNGDLLKECCFTLNEFGETEFIESGSKYIGNISADDGVIFENSFITSFDEKGYDVAKSSLEEIMMCRNSGNASSSFIIQGIGERIEQQQIINRKKLRWE